MRFELTCPNLRSFTCSGKVVGNNARLHQLLADTTQVGPLCQALLVPEEAAVGDGATKSEPVASAPLSEWLGLEIVPLNPSMKVSQDPTNQMAEG